MINAPFLTENYVLRNCFKIPNRLRSSIKEFEKMSVESTERESTPKLVCFLFFQTNFKIHLCLI